MGNLPQDVRGALVIPGQDPDDKMPVEGYAVCDAGCVAPPSAPAAASDGPVAWRWTNDEKDILWKFGADAPSAAFHKEPLYAHPVAYPVIMNGDHAEFEIEHANTKPEDRPDWPLPSFDARDWAAAFCKINPSMDEGLMITWFANALMRGYDEHAARSPQVSGGDAS